MADVKDASLFSAYLDTRPEVVVEETFYSNNRDYLWALIRIIAVLEVGTENSDFTCYYKFPSNDHGQQFITLEHPAVGARLIANAENFKMRYSAAFVLCKLITNKEGRLPTEIIFSSVGGKSTEDLLSTVQFVKIHYPTPPTTAKVDKFMTVCTPSLHHRYANYENLVEFVEFYRMMGVNHFTFYNTSITAKVSQVLDYYVAKKLATVIQWKLPSIYKFERNLRYNGIFAALNDCLYRNSIVDDYTYVVNVDLDEFIVPRKHENFQQMMKYLDRNNQGSFVFRNVFFYLMYDDDPSVLDNTDKPKLILQSKTTRYEEIYEAYSRSKYIAKGKNVIEMNNHRVGQSMKTFFVFHAGETIVDPSIALSHHYRLCEVNELVCWLRETVVDAVAHKFTDQLKRRVNDVFAELE